MGVINVGAILIVANNCPSLASDEESKEIFE